MKVQRSLEEPEYSELYKLKDGTLEALLQERTFSPEEVLALMQQVAEALEPIHEAGTFYQRLSPWNILWSPQTQRFSLRTREDALLPQGHSTSDTLRYTSPEQTGRMDQNPDHRTDFYSLGVVAWQAWVGHPPFEADEPQTLIHAHLAQRPTSPHLYRTGFPPMLSKILLKLLAKGPEDRYQTTRGLLLDLQKVSTPLEDTDKTSFALGEHDQFLRALYSNRLYGRNAEQELLFQALHKTQQDLSAFVWVQGAPGIGKTSLVKSLTKPTHQLRGYFTRGNFELLQMDAPYFAFRTALRTLLEELLTEEYPRLLYWRMRIKQTLRENDGVLVPLLPELGLLLGEYSTPTPLQPKEEQIRTQKAFSDLCRALGASRHPLVLFLDDLQWADNASLQLIEFLLGDPTLKGFVFIGGFRDTELETAPSLRAFLQILKLRYASDTFIQLKTLSAEDIRQMLGELCRCTQDNMSSLASLLREKTAGNPFFIQVLLQQIHQKRLLQLDSSGWSWNEETLRNLAVTENVVSLLLDALQQQAQQTQQALQFAACLGHCFEASTLASILSLPLDALSQLLQPCLAQHILTKQEDNYCFVHDRVQEAAYALLSEEEKTHAHLSIARYLLSQHKDLESTDSLYQIIKHLQQGNPQTLKQEDREQFAQLALLAGRHSHRASAFESAVGYLDWGLRLLGEGRWLSHYELTLQLTQQLVETGAGCRRQERVERYIDELFTHGRSLVEQLPGWQTRILLLIGENQTKEALEVTNAFFALTNTPLIKIPHPLMLLWDLLHTVWLIGRRTPEELEDLPEVRSPLQRGILDLQIKLVLAYNAISAKLVPMMILRDVRGALQHGLTGNNCQCWTGWGAILANIFGKVPLAQRYGELARKQIQRLQRHDLEPQIEFYITVAISVWSDSLGKLGETLLSISRKALSLGDLVTAYSARSLGVYSLYNAGRPLATIDALLQELEQDIERYHYTLYKNPSQVFRQHLTCLQTPQIPTSLALTNLPHLDALVPLKEWSQPAFQMYLYLAFGKDKEALDIALQPRDSLRAPSSVPYRGPYWTYALITLYRGIELGWTTRWKCRHTLRLGHRHLQEWIKHHPKDRQYRQTWLKAAELRSRGKGFLALEQYDKALKQAQDAGFLQDTALIAEQAASLCSSMGHHRMAQNFLQEALIHYQRWGAHAKVTQLQQQTPSLHTSPEQNALVTATSSGEHRPSSDQMLKMFDLEAILQSFEALSHERDRTVLLQRLMKLVMTHAGAERGQLLLRHQDTWRVIAQMETPKGEALLVRRDIALDEDGPELPAAVLRYTLLSHKPVAFADASREGPFTRDLYVTTNKPRSILCLPILLHGQAIGLLYLENRLVANVFSQQRQELLGLLATQAAVSLQFLQNETSPHPNYSHLQHSPFAKTFDASFPLSSTQTDTSHSHSSPLGRQVGDWHILREIEKGGMSVIYEAKHKSNARRSALKLLLPQHKDELSRTRRFEREARILERFHHPHIIPLLDFDTDPTYGPFMALEYLEGENLQAILKRHTPIPLGWLLAISEQLCSALSAIHREGILHRDLKPANIFLTPKEPFPHLYLLDFGIADASKVTQESRLTSTGAIVGTPAYLAPEQLKEKTSLTPATDIYALGVLWFEALTGKHPLGEASAVELFIKILQEAPSRLGQLRPEFQNTELEALFSQLFQKQPEQRPDDIELVWNEFSMSCQFLEDPFDQPERYPNIRE